jgi:hypothetical protein
MSRKTLKDWTLSDGTLLPAGTLIGIAADAMSTSEVCFMHYVLLDLIPCPELLSFYLRMPKPSNLSGSRRCVMEMKNSIP